MYFLKCLKNDKCPDYLSYRSTFRGVARIECVLLGQIRTISRSPRRG